MKGAALKEDRFVDVETIMNYARDAVPTLAKGIGGVQTPQLLKPKGGSFDIGLLEEKDKAAIPLASPKKVFVRSNFINTDEMEDNLGLTLLINEKLSLTTTRGSDAGFVYFDAATFPNACKLSGGYIVKDGIISLSLRLRCGEEEAVSHTVTGKSKEELVEKVMEYVAGVE